MGQIVSASAKPKRCNANQLSQVPTPAAWEHILVSSDNSMNANGQGNFDAYIVGDGTTAASALELKSIVLSGADFVGTVENYDQTNLEKGYYHGTVGSAISGGTNISWGKRIKVPISKGQKITLSTKGYGNGDALNITDANNIVLVHRGAVTISNEVFEVTDDTWAWMYITCADTYYSSFSLKIEKFGFLNEFEQLQSDVQNIENDLENNYEKKALEVDYLSSVVSGKAYKSSGIGTTIVSSSNASFYYAKVPCKKGDVFGIITTGHINAFPAIITDANDIVLWSSGTSSSSFGGVLVISQDNAAYLYVSSYSSTITKLTKLAVKSEDTIVVDSSYAKGNMLSITNGFYTNTGYFGISIPMLMKKGDVAKIKFKSYQNYRGYLLRNADGTMAGYISDTDLAAETLFCWNGDNDVYLYVNSATNYPPSIIKYSKSAAIAMKNYGKRMVALGDSITSYDASDIGELVRGHLGMTFLKTSTQVDFGNIAEGNATICNWSNTTDTCEHNSAAVSGTYVNRTLPNEVLQLLQHITAEGEQISWHINSDNSDHSLATSVGTGAGYTDDIPDLIYIAMGTNDTVTTDDFDEVIAQTYSQLTKLTICSALRWCLETLQNVFPKATIVCVTPIKRGTRSIAEMEAKCALIKKICNYMAIPVVDGYNISGYSPLSYGLYSSDTIHPNTNTQRIARSIAAQVDALC